MASEKFSLLEKKYPEDAKSGIDNEHILKLRQQARDLRAENNKWVNQLWDIAQQLTKKDLSPTKRNELHDLKAGIDKKISEESYIERINKLLDEIQTLEISLYGHSEVNSNSPYPL